MRDNEDSGRRNGPAIAVTLYNPPASTNTYSPTPLCSPDHLFRKEVVNYKALVMPNNYGL